MYSTYKNTLKGKAEGDVLNSKDEYTRCVIPALSVSHQETQKPSPQQPTTTAEIEATSNKRPADQDSRPLGKRARKDTKYLDMIRMPPPPLPTTATTTQGSTTPAPKAQNNRPQQGKPTKPRPITIKEMIQKMKMKSPGCGQSPTTPPVTTPPIETQPQHCNGDETQQNQVEVTQHHNIKSPEVNKNTNSQGNITQLDNTPSLDEATQQHSQDGITCQR